MKRYGVRFNTVDWLRLCAVSRGMREQYGGHSVNRIIEEAVRRECARLEEKYNDGERWPRPRNAKLRAGRPPRLRKEAM